MSETPEGRARPMPATEVRPEYSVGEMVRVVTRRKWTILLTVVVVLGAVLGYDLQQTKVYASTAGVELNPQYTINPASGVGSSGEIDIPNSIALVTSHPVVAAVSKLIGGPAPAATAAQVGSTDVMAITVEAGSPEAAARDANAYATAFLEIARARAAAEVGPVEEQLNAEINQDNQKINGLSQQLLNSKTTAKQALAINNQLSNLQFDLQTTRTELRQIQLEADANEQAGSVLNPARPDGTPVRPRPERDGAIALLGGLVIGFGLAFIREYLDDRIRTKDELERALGDIPVLGLVPFVEEWQDRTSPYLVSRDKPHSPAPEAYRSVRTAIRFMALGKSVKTLEVTSPSANDGKTSTTANLAVAMALAGQRVVTVSCDLRRPRLHEFFNASNDVGLTTVLIGETSVREALVDVPGISNLRVLPSGPVPPNPSELLSLPTLSTVLEELAQDADIVLLDSPPALPVTDAIALSANVDAVLMVAAAGNTTKRNLARAIGLLDRIDAKIVGAVLNGAPRAETYGYVAYGYYYADADADKKAAGSNGHVPKEAASESPATVVADPQDPANNGSAEDVVGSIILGADDDNGGTASS